MANCVLGQHPGPSKRKGRPWSVSCKEDQPKTLVRTVRRPLKHRSEGRDTGWGLMAAYRLAFLSLWRMESPE